MTVRVDDGGGDADGDESAAAAAATPPLPPPAPSAFARAVPRLAAFWRKFHGNPDASAPLRPPLAEATYASISAGLAMLALSGIHVAAVHAHPHALQQLVAPFGASSVLLFATPTSPLAQPRNLVGGNTLSALVGVIVRHIFGDALPWLSPFFAVGFAVLVMAVTRCMHPPAGAMALTALARRPDSGFDNGFLFVLIPAASGSLLLLLMALLANNLHPRQKYPQHWL